MGHLVSGQFEEALVDYERGKKFLPNRAILFPFLAVTYVNLGRIEEAKETMDDLKKKMGLNLKQIMYGPGKFRELEFQTNFANSLIKSGMSHGPCKYYRISEENKKHGNEIKKLIFGNTISGSDFWTNEQWRLTYKYKGSDKAVYSSKEIEKDVVTWIEDDMFCKQGKKLYGGVEDCAYVYANPNGKPENNDEYLFMTDYGIYPFSIVAEYDK